MYFVSLWDLRKDERETGWQRKEREKEGSKTITYFSSHLLLFRQLLPFTRGEINEVVVPLSTAWLFFIAFQIQTIGDVNVPVLLSWYFHISCMYACHTHVGVKTDNVDAGVCVHIHTGWVSTIKELPRWTIYLRSFIKQTPHATNPHSQTCTCAQTHTEDENLHRLTLPG